MIFEGLLEKLTQQQQVTSSSERGFLVCIGGNEDKRDAKKILRTVATLRTTTCVSVIPTASMYGRELGEEYVDLFLKMNVGITKGYVIDARTKEDVMAKPEYIAHLAESDLIFFTGGDQVRLVEAFKNTTAMSMIYDRFLHGATIAGTSAGAAAASHAMIYDGDDEAFLRGAVQHTEGFGFLQTITIDTHFLQRNRIPRLVQFLAQHGSEYAIGLDEDTGIIVSPHDSTCTVFGSAMVTFMQSKGMKYTDYDTVRNGTLYSVDGLGMSFCAAGTKFDLASWQIVAQ
ncbi:MAG: cyanophycinase [Candidatus Kapaibacterium sp.]|nr:MAG: cyanophycinase [Candidatus Kapabacteria bacterium]